MTIAKLSHCCLLIEGKGLRILTDPGIYSDAQNALENIDLVLITHEHSDHLHIESLKIVLKNNPNAVVYTTQAVSDLLKVENIKATVFKNGDSQTFSAKGGSTSGRSNVSIEAYGELHAQIHSTIPQSTNIGFFIDNKLFYPGDAFTIPGKQVDVLALPVAGPWVKISDAVDYALQVNPKIAFPVHDAVLKAQGGTSFVVPKLVLEKQNIQFIELYDGQRFDFSSD